MGEYLGSGIWDLGSGIWDPESGIWGSGDLGIWGAKGSRKRRGGSKRVEEERVDIGGKVNGTNRRGLIVSELQPGGWENIWDLGSGISDLGSGIRNLGSGDLGIWGSGGQKGRGKGGVGAKGSRKRGWILGAK